LFKTKKGTLRSTKGPVIQDTRYKYTEKTRKTYETTRQFGFPDRWLLRLLERAMIDLSRSELLPRGGTMLDYGCGERPYQELFAPHFTSIIGADFPGNTTADSIVGPQGQLSDVRDSSFDFVLSTQVLEHVEDPRVYLREARRVLKTGGILALSTHGMYRYHADPVDYWRWTRTGLELEISRAGFEVLSTKSIFRLPSIALMFWQNSTEYYVPGFLRKLYVEWHQFLIGLLEKIPSRKGKVVEDAAIHIVIARKV
jgi:SAM-dependent methyltransferase